MGATAMATIDMALRYAKSGYDGIIHVKSADAPLRSTRFRPCRISRADYHIPILFLSYDTQTSDTGLNTPSGGLLRHDRNAQTAHK